MGFSMDRQATDRHALANPSTMYDVGLHDGRAERVNDFEAVAFGL
jgi:hypothetical protein